MSIKLIKIDPKYTRAVLIAVAGLCMVLSWFFLKWNLGDVIASQVDAKSPEASRIADWLIEFAPSDPRTHFLAGNVYEKTFNADDLDRSVQEYELATALSPHNYTMWMHLGRARNLVGDAEGSFRAYRKALDLAPNYSGVQWIYGNALLREGRTDEGLAIIAVAAVADPRYASPAVTTALQIFEGNVAEVRRALGNGPTINAALVEALLSTDRLDESFEAWERFSPEAKRSDHKNLGEKLQSKLIEQKRFRIAASINADIATDQAPAVSNVVNGGFEENIKIGNAGLFNWRISEGTHPQVGLSDEIMRSGKYSLLLLFNSFDASGLRSFEQTIAVEPGSEYELEIFYRSDIRSDASLKWEVVNAANLETITQSDPITQAPDWTPLRIRFRTPSASDGIQIRLVRQGCGLITCAMGGRLFFDDISLQRF